MTTALTKTPTPAHPRPVAEEAQEKRLLAAVAEIGDILAAEAAPSEAGGQLTNRAVEVLRSRDLWRMRLCAELGGLELPIVSQIKVLAALAEKDASSAWCTMVANSSVAILGATMPEAAVKRIFARGVPACAIVAAAGGKAIEVADGFLLTGTWRLASGIHHADWVHATALVNGDPSRVLPLALPAQDLKVLDSWHPVGLASTGSNDFSLTDYFLPANLAGRAANPNGQLRGTRRYDLVSLDRLEAYEHLAFAIGISRHALDELRRLLAHGSSSRHTADREVVQSQLGHAHVQLQAIEALALSVYSRVDAAALGDALAWSDTDRYLPRALAVWATQHALECTQLAFHRAGAAAVTRPNILEKLLLDMSVAASHVMVDDTAVVAHAQQLIESVDIEPVKVGHRHAD